MSKPKKKFQCGSVSVAIWENQIQTANGPQTAERVTVERRYKDNATGEWKSTNGFAANDLPKAIMALQKAYEFIAFKKSDDNEDDDGPQ